MSTSSTPTNAEPAAVFPQLLKEWRRRRHLSQFDLSLASGVTQRHVSFLESGRARPSRSMVLQLSEVLDVPLRDRNDLLLAAGFAPAFRARALEDPQMTQIVSAVRMMLDTHDPYPALAVDRGWNIRLANRSFEAFTAMVDSDLWARVGGSERNMARLFFHPDGLRRFVANWAEIAPVLWHRARREADAIGGGEMNALLGELAPGVDVGMSRAAERPPLLPVLPFVVERNGVRLSLFTIISTFGTAQDVTTDELRIEQFFPADAETETLLRSVAA